MHNKQGLLKNEVRESPQVIGQEEQQTQRVGLVVFEGAEHGLKEATPLRLAGADESVEVREKRTTSLI